MPEMLNDSFVAFHKVNTLNSFKQNVDETGLIITKLS